MTEYTFKVDLSGITELECFKEASKDELKVLLALASLGGEPISPDRLSEITDVSKARIKASIALFEEYGVISSTDGGMLADVEYEFTPTEKQKPGAKEIARTIRDNDLYELNRELENIFRKTLEVRELARIASLYTEKGLSMEYILTLTAFIQDTRKRPSVEMVYREANNLLAKDIDNLEALEIYMKEKREAVPGEMEMRLLFGIRDRTLTKSEREYFKKWLVDFGYSGVIIGEAYDITVKATSKLSLPYIDKILTEWHASECKTLEECRAKSDSRSHEMGKKAKNSSQNKKKSVEAETPKYTDFNSEDALMRALERSYGDAE